MVVTVQEIREKLIPLLCLMRIGYRKCHDPRCDKAIDRVQEWLDQLWEMEHPNENKTNKTVVENYRMD
jgi:hypothetical protein